MRREALPEQVREEMDALLDVVLTFAVHAVEKFGEFYAFGGFVREERPELLAIGVEDEHPRDTDLIADLEEALRKLAGDGARAGAIAADVRLDDGDAIRVHLEHAEGDSVDLFMPYRKKKLRGVDFGELSASAGERIFFG